MLKDEPNISIEEYARRTGFSISTIRRRIKDKTIVLFQPGGRRTRMSFPPEAAKVPPTPKADPGPAATQTDAPPSKVLGGNGGV